MGTVLEFLSGSIGKVAQKDRAKWKMQRIRTNTAVSSTAQERVCLSGGGVPDRSQLASQKRKPQLSKDETSLH